MQLPSLKLSYQRLSIGNVDGSAVPLQALHLDLYSLSRPWVRGGFEAEAGRGTAAFSEYYMADNDSAIFRSSLRKNVVFSQHNLVCDSVFNEFQLIVCRNVLMYFDQTLRERVHDLFDASLSNFGVLILGKKESLRFTPHGSRYRELGEGLRIYRRLG